MIKEIHWSITSISIKNITQKGNARTLDLFLDVLVLPSTGEYELVDENDLKLALKMNKSLKAIS